jgi:uncharacterized protein (DUF2062 family)
VGWDLFIEMVKVFGLPLTMAFVAILAFMRGDVVTKRTYEDMLKEKDRQILREQDQLADLWDGVVRPTLAVGSAALDKVEREQRDKPRSRS